MSENTQQQSQALASPADLAISEINKQIVAGLTLPSHYNHVNAIKSSILVLADMKDRDGQSIIKSCTPVSVQVSLVRMAQAGLDVSKGQGYFCKRGNQLVFQKEYHGVTTQIQRMYPNYTPNPRVVYEGDVFKYGTDPKTGRRVLLQHDQDIENLDNEFKAAYLYIPCADGGQDLYVMTKKMIMEAWMQSSNKSLTVHKRFVDKMVCKTIINSALTPLVNASDSTKESHVVVENEWDAPEEPQQELEVVDVDATEVIDVETGEVQQSENLFEAQ